MKVEERIKLQSLKLLLSTSQNEYSNEHKRTTTIDSKAGIALPIIATYFLALAQMNDYKSIVAIPVSSFWSSLLPLALVSTFTVALILAFIALVYMIRTVFPKEYHKVNPVELYSEDKLTKKYSDFLIEIMHLYFDAISLNRKTNNQRFALYEKSWLLMFFSLACFVIYIVIKNNT